MGPVSYRVYCVVLVEVTSRFDVKFCREKRNEHIITTWAYLALFLKQGGLIQTKIFLTEIHMLLVRIKLQKREI